MINRSQHRNKVIIQYKTAMPLYLIETIGCVKIAAIIIA